MRPRFSQYPRRNANKNNVTVTNTFEIDGNSNIAFGYVVQHVALKICALKFAMKLEGARRFNKRDYRGAVACMAALIAGMSEHGVESSAHAQACIRLLNPIQGKLINKHLLFKSMSFSTRCIHLVLKNQMFKKNLRFFCWPVYLFNFFCLLHYTYNHEVSFQFHYPKWLHA